MKYYRKFYFIVLSVFFLNILSGCTSASISEKKDTSIDKEQNEIKDVLSNKNNENKKISVNNRCTGCNRCIMVDKNHFSYQLSDRLPKIKSQENLESNNLLLAINGCPTSAIILR